MIIFPTYSRFIKAPPQENINSLMEKMTALSIGQDQEFIEFRHVLELFPQPILILSSKIKILYVNPSWEQLTGYTLSEVMGMNAYTLHDPSIAPKLHNKMWKLIRSGKSFQTEHLLNRKKNGATFQMRLTTFPLVREGSILFYIQVIEDITKQKKLEELKKGFLSSASHELKTPITTLKMITQSLLRKETLNRQVFKKIALIDRELDRLTRIINDLSEVSRIETGKMNIEIKAVNITQLIIDVVEQMKTLTHKSKIIFKVPAAIFVQADPDRVKQVMINILNNAIKYSPSESVINVSLQTRNNHAITCIKDQGHGIPKDKLKYIFNRFYQLGPQRKSGFGLGLYIVREIIRLHHGKIWVKSKEGKGSMFCFSLKLQS